MLNNKWMIISLLIGNILLCSLVSSIPLYSDAILQRMLTKQLEQQQIQSNKYPGTVEIKFNSLNVNSGYEIKSLNTFENKILEMEKILGIPLTQKVTSYSLNNFRTELQHPRDSTVKNRSLQLSFYSDLADHITITSGRMYSDELQDGVIEVIVNERTLVEQDLLFDEVMMSPTFTYQDGTPIKFKVVGVFKNSSDSDPYWVYNPTQYSYVCLMSENLFRNLFIENFNKYYFTSQWYLLFDYTKMSPGNVTSIIDKTTEIKTFFDRYGTNACRVNYMDTLQGFTSESARLNVTLWVLQVPIFVLLAFFIFMVSKQILEQEKNAIAVLKSRGASRIQIILIFLGQSAIISFVSVIAGIPLGTLICRVLGSANGFLNLVQRTALNVQLNKETFIYTIAAALLSVLTMVIPAFNYSKVTIVDHKRQRSRKSKSPVWQRFFIDFLLFGISLYGFYTYNNQKEFLLSSNAKASLDPLLFISSSLFIIGAGLIFMRLFPYFIRLIYAIGKQYWPPSLYASFLKVTRSVGEEQFIMIFLILTVATGIFNAKAARTINLNMEENIRYQYGADLVLKEEWRDNSASESAKMRVYFEPDFERYTKFGDSVKVTKVLNSKGNRAGTLKDVRVMGINTKEFGEIAWFRNGLLPAHWYEYLNTMASNARAVLVSMNFHTKQGYNLGDTISIRNENDSYFTGIICGFIDYWPTYYPTVTTYLRDGTEQVSDQWLVVANLSQVQAAWGVTPYEIWMKTDSNQFIYNFAEEQGLKFETFLDADAEIIEQKNDPVFQGTNGILTVGFIIILLVCMTGFLIYWILSIRSRELQFGIFRAMGMPMKGILGLLLNEQVLISGVSVALGSLAGFIASNLYVPLIQLGYASSANTLPLKVIAEGSDYFRLFSVIGFMFVVCMIILGVIISKIKIAQALKLGED